MQPASPDTVPYGVIVTYSALFVWIGTFISGVCSIPGNGGKGYIPFIVLGLFIALFLNVRYLFEGIPAGLRFFNGMYDVIVNLGENYTKGELPPNVVRCDNGQDCSVWGENHFPIHSAWAVAMYRRFQPGSDPTRSIMFYIHIISNSIAFFLVHYQILYPGGLKKNKWHALLGKICFLCATVGALSALWMSSEHDAVPEYGGFVAEVGFWLMCVCMWVPAAVGIIKMRNADMAGHRAWMVCFAGGLWGTFWGTRIPALVLDPFFRSYPIGTNFCISVWISGPMGLIGGEIALNRKNKIMKSKEN